jgi:hypothetical protein
VLVRAHAPAQSTWCWGAHHAGWAFGAVLAALLVHLLGLSPLMPIAVVSYVLGALLFFIASWAAERSGAGASRPATEPAT